MNQPGMQGPVAALARPILSAWYLDEAIVEWEVVSERVLPFLSVVAIVGKLVHDKLVYVAQWKHLLIGCLDCHGGQCDVWVWWLLITVRRFTWSWHVCFIWSLICSGLSQWLNDIWLASFASISCLILLF